MQRRAFIRQVGGGIAAVAATGGLAGCTDGMPPEAVAAWQGPGAQTDPRRWMLGYALLAPHSHNLQSWQVDLREPGQITLYCDPGRLLPQTDPLGRQILMSHGTFLELLDLAARERGLRADIRLFPDGGFEMATAGARPIAQVRLAPDAAVRPDPLFAGVLRRHTNREAYDPARPVADAAWAAMAAAAAATGEEAGLRFGHLGPADPPALARHRRIADAAWRIELTTPRTILESYRVLRVGADEVARHRDGLTLLAPAVVWLNRLGLFDRSHAPAADSWATRSQLDDFRDKLQSTTGFLWLVSGDNRRESQVDAGRAYVRVQLAAALHGVSMQPLSQALQEYPEQAGPYRDIHAELGATAPGATVQMWARVGYAPPVGPAPRRPLDAIIRG
jgi:hypothetical protein